MKKTVKHELNEMKNLVKNMPKSLNETINFNEIEDPEEYDEELPAGDEMEEVDDEPDQITASEHAAQLIDDIRKKALRAMADLAETPEDENYIMLKKVWQMTDRKPEQQQQQNNGQIQQLSGTIQKAVNESIFDFFKKKKDKETETDDEENSSVDWSEVTKNMKKSGDKFKHSSTSSILNNKSDHKYGSSDPFSTKETGWKGDKYHDPAGTTSNNDSSKDWMFGDR